jgi:hypothetical protein
MSHDLDVHPGPHNPNGHTLAEILAGLRYQTGSRKLSFRYELLDSNNRKIGDLDQVESCSVQQDWLSDIKRQATFVLRSVGAIDFLSDRVKPWVRLHLPPHGDDDWVEWPQGVFLLSTPERTTDANETVRRAVSGYDQLKIYLEDTTYGRLTVPAGTRYTDAVLDMLVATNPIVVTQDGFGRVDATSWGDNEDGHTWTSYGTVNATYAVSGGQGHITVPASDNAYMALAGIAMVDMEVKTLVTSTTAGSFTGVVMRFSEPAAGQTLANGYGCAINGTTGDLEIYRNISGTGATLLDSAAIPGWTANTRWYLRFRAIGPLLQGKTWAEDSPEPAAWSVEVTDTTYTGGTAACQRIGTDTARFDDFRLIDPLSGVVISHSAAVLQVDKEWDPGTPMLHIINELLGAINYNSLSFDAEGRAVIAPYVSPQDRHPSYVYADDEVSVLHPEVTQELDLFSVANRWVLIMSEPDQDPIVSVFTNNDPGSPTSTVRRQRVITDFRTEIETADQITLDEKAARLAFEASQVFEAIEFTTALMPFHDGNDVIQLGFNPLAVFGKYAEVSWSMPLTADGVMTHRVRRVVNIGG